MVRLAKLPLSRLSLLSVPLLLSFHRGVAAALHRFDGGCAVAVPALILPHQGLEQHALHGVQVRRVVQVRHELEPAEVLLANLVDVLDDPAHGRAGIRSAELAIAQAYLNREKRHIHPLQYE